MKWLRLFLVTLLAIAIVVPVVWAQASQDFDLHWNVLGGGGGRSAGGNFALHGTIGQPAVTTLTGGPFVLQGGFWLGPAAPEPPPGHAVFLPLVTHNAP